MFKFFKGEIYRKPRLCSVIYLGLLLIISRKNLCTKSRMRINLHCPRSFLVEFVVPGCPSLANLGCKTLSEFAGGKFLCTHKNSSYIARWVEQISGFTWQQKSPVARATAR